jgi:UDP-N-acetylmuramoyl-tripeptide--D-alanyl-D-alanine ligase
VYKMKALLKHIVVYVLTVEARLVLKRYKPQVVAITGSVGKTGTKDAIYTVLRGSYRVRKSEKSFNSEIGVPLTILGLPNAWASFWGWVENIVDGLMLVVTRQDYPAWLVLEVGADHPGDIARLRRWLGPQTVVLTRFPEVPVHVEHFGSREAVIEEKRELRRALVDTGTLIVNADDELVRDEPIGPAQRKLSYGFAKDASVRGSRAIVRYDKGVPVGVSCSVSFLNEKAELRIDGTLGTHQLYALLAATTVGVSEGMTLARATEACSDHTAPPGRMRLLLGIENSVLIDDSYNSSPVAALAALETQKSVKCKGKRVCILGDMMELGEFSVNEHRKLGEHVASVCDVFITVGVRMQEAAEAAKQAGMAALSVHTAQDSAEAGKMAREVIGTGDVVLVKGSQSTRMERVVKALLRNHEDEDKLVRQGIEWERR